MPALNENIKAMRIAFGWNQVELAKRLCVSKQCISNWENDNVQPSVEMLLKLADLFAVSTDRLLGRDDKKIIDADGLTDEQCAHIQMIVRDIVRNTDRRAKVKPQK
ncbi:MAG: helix-turn-helix transcriptional regulator [Clostridia bacterium]|nr:helix-turn-helix transcriptional regulator [Clostridia bacterium]